MNNNLNPKTIEARPKLDQSGIAESYPTPAKRNSRPGLVWPNLIKVALICVLCVQLPSLGWSQNRVATVNMEKVFSHYWKTKELDAALSNWKIELDKAEDPLIDRMQQAQDAYQQLLDQVDNPSLPAMTRKAYRQKIKEKAATLKEIEGKVADFDREARATLELKQDHMRYDLLADITAAIDVQVKAGGYLCVLDSSTKSFVSNGEYPFEAPLVVYSDPLDDITQSVLAQLNAKAPDTITKSTDDTLGLENLAHMKQTN